MHHKVVYRSDIFSPDYMWNSKVKIWVWARLVKRHNISVSTSHWSSHMSQCLRNNWVTRGMHTLVHFTAHTHLHMHKTPPDAMLAGGWNNLKPHRDCCRNIGHFYIGLHYYECCRYAPGHHQPPSRLEYGYDGATDIMLQPLNKECSREVVRIVGKWNYVTCLQDKINFISCRLQSTNNISFQNSYCAIWDTKSTGNKTYQTNLVIKYKRHEYVVLPHPYAIRPYLWLHWGVEKHYMTGYVSSKLTSIMQSMTRLLSFHDLSYAPSYIYAFS